MRKEIICVGSGGQGIILGGHILAEAAGIYDGRNVANSERYGAAARGGVSVSEIVISDEEIDYPKITKADCMICLSQEGYDTYKDALKKEGILIADSFYVNKTEHKNVHVIPLSEVVREKTGREIGTNIAALGAFVRITGMVSEKAIREAVKRRVPKGTEDFNLRILDIGLGKISEEIKVNEREQDLQEEYISILEVDTE
jgi:2-oxoglutarate ferredoxin oxidoreductase subunit gamma